MTRLTVGIDRTVTAVLAVALAILALLALDWRLGGPLHLSSATSTTAAVRLTTRTWWPGVLGIAGLVLVLVGLRWLWAHVRRTAVSHLNLAGTGKAGRLRVNARSAASAAAGTLTDQPGVRSARGSVIRDRGQLVVVLRADLTPDADLRELTSRCDSTATQLAHVLGRSDVYCRIHLRVTTSASTSSRVQ